MRPPTGASLSSRKLLSSIGIGAVVAAVAIFVGATATPDGPRILSGWADEESPPAPISTTNAEVAPMATTTSAATTTPTTPTTPTQSPYAIDDRGFVNTEARCDSTQITVAFGRTERSIVAICADQSGAYEYRGVRLSDRAGLTAPVEAQDDGEYVAREDGITYVVSSQEFYLMSGSEVIREEPWLEYHEPRLAAESSPADTAPASDDSAETTPRTSSPETFEPVG